MSFELLELTLRISIVATLVNLPIALLVSWYLVRTRAPGRFLVDVLVSLPLAVPPVAIGFFLLILLGREGPVGAVSEAIFGSDLVFT